MLLTGLPYEDVLQQITQALNFRTEQKPILAYPSDLETIMRATVLFHRVCQATLKKGEATNAFDTYHKVYAPVLRNYTDVRSVREILNNFEPELKRNYAGKY